MCAILFLLLNIVLFTKLDKRYFVYLLIYLYTNFYNKKREIVIQLPLISIFFTIDTDLFKQIRRYFFIDFYITYI